MRSDAADRAQQALIAIELKRIRENGERYKNGKLFTHVQANTENANDLQVVSNSNMAIATARAANGTT